MIVTLEDLTHEMLRLKALQKEIVKDIDRIYRRWAELMREKAENKSKLEVIIEQIEIYNQTKEG